MFFPCVFVYAGEGGGAGKKVVCPLRISGEILPQVEKFKYLGVLFTSEGKVECEIRCGVCSDAVASPICRGEEGAKLKGKSLD